MGKASIESTQRSVCLEGGLGEQARCAMGASAMGASRGREALAPGGRFRVMVWVLGITCALGLEGCGGAASEPAPPPSGLVEVQEPVSEEEVREEEETEEPAPPPETSVEPEFRPDMTVNEAIAAVPASVQRVNIDPDALAAPLLRSELYEPCGVRGNQRFTVRVAVWNGRAVGMDVSTQPKNDKLSGCLREQIASVTWPDKVKSLNTVEYSY